MIMYMIIQYTKKKSHGEPPEIKRMRDLMKKYPTLTLEEIVDLDEGTLDKK